MDNLNVFTGRLHISANNAAACEEYIRLVHTRYPKQSYTQVLNACVEMCSRHPEPSLESLHYLSLGISRYVDQFEEIMLEKPLRICKHVDCQAWIDETCKICDVPICPKHRVGMVCKGCLNDFLNLA